jgi:hypothetical protein
MNESDFMRERRERADAEQYQLDRMRALQRMLLVRLLMSRALHLCLRDDPWGQAILAYRQRTLRAPRRPAAPA